MLPAVVSEPDVEPVVLPHGALHLDARHFPVLLVTWFGVPDPQLVERYVDWLLRMADRAVAEGTRIVVLGDTTGMEERPGPEMRRAMATGIDRIMSAHPGTLLGVTSVIGQPVMRAVITMVLAITRRQLDLRPVKDLAHGLARTFELLDAAGIPRPPGLDAATHRRPERPR